MPSRTPDELARLRAQRATGALICKRPACSVAVEQPRGRSRPRLFCSDTCRRLFDVERGQAEAALRVAILAAAQYGIATPADPASNTTLFSMKIGPEVRTVLERSIHDLRAVAGQAPSVLVVIGRLETFLAAAEDMSS